MQPVARGLRRHHRGGGSMRRVRDNLALCATKEALARRGNKGGYERSALCCRCTSAPPRCSRRRLLLEAQLVGTLEAGPGLVMSSKLPESQAAVVPGVGVVLLEGDEALEACQGLLGALEPAARHAAVEPRHGFALVQLEGALEAGQRLLKAVEVQEGATAVDPGAV